MDDFPLQDQQQPPVAAGIFVGINWPGSKSSVFYFYCFSVEV